MEQNQKPPRRNTEGQYDGGGADKGGWKKGISGNPGGRRKGNPRDREDYQKLAKRYSLVALRRLCRLMEDPATDAEVRRKCAVKLLDRAWGRPTESVEINASTQSQVLLVTMTDDPATWEKRTQHGAQVIEDERAALLIEHKAKANGEAVR